MRSRQSDSSQSITAMPIMLLPKDGGTTLQTMLSLYEDDLFETGQAKQDDSGAWRIDADPRLQKVLPVRAYAMSKDGIGMLAIFRGGDGDAWIEPAWKSMQQSLSFPDESRVNEMVSAGEEAAKRIADAGLRPDLCRTIRMTSGGLRVSARRIGLLGGCTINRWAMAGISMRDIGSSRCFRTSNLTGAERRI